MISNFLVQNYCFSLQVQQRKTVGNGQHNFYFIYKLMKFNTESHHYIEILNIPFKMVYK